MAKKFNLISTKISRDHAHKQNTSFSAGDLLDKITLFIQDKLF